MKDEPTRPVPLRLVVCFRTFAAIAAFDGLVRSLAGRRDVPHVTTLMRTTDPHDVLRFLERPAYASDDAPTMRYDCAFLLDATLDAPGSGIELADRIRDRSVDVPILFVSEHLEYVLLSFRSQPFDFLPRPVAAERLAESLRGLARMQDARREESLQRRAALSGSALPTGYRRREDPSHDDRNVVWTDTTTPVAFRCHGTIHRIAAGEILFVERNDTVTTIHLAARRIDCGLPISWFAERLAPTGIFVRCHKSFLVNRRHIRLIDIKEHFLALSYGHRCDIGRTYRKAMTAFRDPRTIRSANPEARLHSGREGDL